MSRADEMAAFWDRAAREDPLVHVDDRRLDEEAFWLSGEEIVANYERLLGLEIGGDVVVEVGCGVGRITRTLAQRAGRVIALDISAEMLALASARNAMLGNVDWRLGDGETLAGVPDAAADGVFSHVVFQHIPDPAITLGYVTEIGRVLRPGGWAAFQVSDDPGVHRRLRFGLRGRRPAAWRGSAVDLHELRRTAAAAGLEVQRIWGAGTQFCLVALRRTG
jgi:SAM-dependent methyltransferase